MHRQILRIAVPSIISNITVPLLGLVDVAITGHLGSTAYLGAMALSTLFFNILYWGFGFLRMGTSGLLAQAYGRNDPAEILRVLTQALTAALTISLLILIFQIPLIRGAFRLLDADPLLERYATAYVRIAVWGAPAVLGLYVFYGGFIGMQNARFQMYVAVSMNIANILLSTLFVFGFGMKIEGVALGTLLAQYGGLLLAGILWRKRYGDIGKEFKIMENLRWDEMGKFFTVNRDIFLRTLCLIAVTAFFTYAGTRQGEAILAANTLMMQLFTLFSYFMDGFAHAGEALVGKYVGRRDPGKLRRTIRLIFQWGVALSFLFTGIYLAGGKLFLRILTNDALVIQTASSYLGWAAAIPFAGFAAFLWDGIYVGATQTRYLLYGIAGATATFFGVVFLFGGLSDNNALWLAFILYLILRGLIQTLFRSQITAGIRRIP